MIVDVLLKSMTIDTPSSKFENLLSNFCTNFVIELDKSKSRCEKENRVEKRQWPIGHESFYDRFHPTVL